jgi:hypothetical protein
MCCRTILNDQKPQQGFVVAGQRAILALQTQGNCITVSVGNGCLLSQ